jgi:hypothetical protein
MSSSHLVVVSNNADLHIAYYIGRGAADLPFKVLTDNVNLMAMNLTNQSVFAHGVTRVARGLGTEDRLGGQARVTNVGGTWKDLTDNVNVMAANVSTLLPLRDFQLNKVA